MLAGFLGWTLDAFDFFVVVFLIDTLAHHFGVPKKDIVRTMTATLAMRPVGAILFGLLADRYGRRIPLMIGFIVFAVSTVGCALAPSLTVLSVFRATAAFGAGLLRTVLSTYLPAFFAAGALCLLAAGLVLLLGRPDAGATATAGS